MALPIPTDGQQMLRQLVKDVERLKRTAGTGAAQTVSAESGASTETIYLPEAGVTDGVTFIGDSEMSEEAASTGPLDGDGESTLPPEMLWVVTPSAPVCSTTMQSVTVTWDGLGSGGETLPGNFGLLEIHRSIDEFFNAQPAADDYEQSSGGTLVGVMSYPGSIVFDNQMYDVPYYYRFVLVTSDRRHSQQSDATMAMAVPISSGDIDPGIFDDVFNDMNESIAEAQETADNAIASYAPEYAVSDSETVPPTTGWSTATPVRTPGTYIWYRTTVTYGNGATSTTNPALLTGNDGADGAPGTPAPDITLTATTQILAAPAGGGTTTPATSVVTGVATNTTITAWLYSVDGGAFSATVPAGVSRTANAVTITGSTMTAKTIAVRMADAGTTSDTLTVAKVTEGAGGTPGTPGAPGADGMTILLSNEAQTFAAGTTNAQAGTATTTVIAYKGSVQQTATVGTITGGATGITAAVTNNGTTAPLVTFTVTTALATANGTFTIPVTAGGITVNQIFTWSLAFSGAAGAPGTPAAVVSLNATTQVLTSPAGGGVTSPATSVVAGTTANTTITVWEYSVDGAAFSATVPAGTSRTGNTVTITGSTMTAKTLTVRMADAAGVADTMTVAKVSDGATGGAGTPGTPGADAYTVLLSNESQTFAAGTTNAQAATATSTVIAYKGAVAQTATVGTITGGATGITAAVTNNGTTAPLITFTVTTALVAANGTFTIPVTVAGITFTQVFTWSLAFTGTTGTPGTPGAPASIVDLVTTTQVLTSPAAGGATTPATAVLTGSATNTTISGWSYSVDGGTFTGTPPTGLVLAGNVVTITGGTMTAKTIAVRATGASGVTDTITVAKNYDGAPGGTGPSGGTGPAGADAYTVLLSNEAQTFTAGTTNALAGSATSTVIAYKGTVAQTSTVGTITGGATGITAAVTNNGTTAPLITFTVTTALATANGTFTIPVTVGGMTFTQVFSWSLSFSGATGTPGTPGAPASVVDLVATTQTLTSPAGGGATTPATAVITGSATNTTISGWTYSVDGGTFTGTPPTGVGLAGNVVTITGSTMTAKTIAVRATGASGVTDTMTVAKVSDGATGGAGAPGGTGPAGADAYTVLLTNEAQVFPGTVAAAIAGSATTSVLAYKATTAQTATIGTITGQVAGLTTAITNNGTTAPLVTVTVTTSLTTGGTLTIPVTVGGIVFTKLFSWSVSFAGATGGPGGIGPTGISVLSVTPYFYQVTTGAAAPALPTVSPPPAPWTATEPTYVANTELYRSERVLYSSGPPQYTAVTKVSSYAAATAAMASANGKNQVIYSTSDASGTSMNGVAFIDDDTWFKYQTSTTPHTVIAQWRFVTNAWVPQKVHGDSLAYLDAGTITAGYLDVANRINAGSIHALKMQASTIRSRELVISDTSNMCEINEAASVGTIFDSQHAIVSGWSTRTPTTSGYYMFRDKQGPLHFKTGDRIRLVFEAYADAAVTATPYLWVYGDATVTQPFATVPLTTTATVFERELTVTATTALKTAYMIGLNGVAGRDVFVRNARAYIMNAGELIVDGTIKADHIAAGSVTADKVALGVLRSNMVADPSFEESYTFSPWDPFNQWAGIGSTPGHRTQWRRGNAPGGGSVTRSVGLGRSRSGNAGASVYAVAGQEASVISNAFPLTVGKQYRITINCVSVGSAATLVVQAPSASHDNPTGFETNEALTGDSTWANPLVVTEPFKPEQFQKFSYTFTASNTWAVLRILNLNPGANSTLVVDDVSVVMVNAGGASELTAAGLRLFDNEGDEVTGLVSNRRNLFSVQEKGQTLALVNEDGGATFQTLSVDGVDSDADGRPDSGVTIYGTEFLRYFDAMPRGVVEWGGRYNSSNQTNTTTGVGLYELEVAAYANRMYRLSTGACRVRSTLVDDKAELRVYVTYGTLWDPDSHPGSPSPTSAAVLGRSPVTTINYIGGEAMTLTKLWMPSNGGAEDYRFLRNVRLLLAVTKVNTGTGFVYVDGSTADPIEFWVEDIGPAEANGAGGQESNDAGSTPPATTPPKTYTKTYTSTGWAMYNPTSRKTNAEDVKQGYSSYDGNASGYWIFPAFTGAVGAKSISKIRVYLYANHWYYNSGGTAVIATHTQTTILSTRPTLTNVVNSASWPKPGGRWVTLPSSTHAAFLAGTTKGIGVGPAPSNSLTYYGRFNGAGAKVEITYVR